MPYDRLLGLERASDTIVASPAVPKVLVNGANHNVALGATSYVPILGPASSFSITGFAGGTNGRVLIVHNTTANAMTLANQNLNSATRNRLVTLTGADVVLAAGASTGVFVYNTTIQRWVLLAARDATGAV